MVKNDDNNSSSNIKKNENETSQSTNLDIDTKTKLQVSNEEELQYNKKVVGSILGLLGIGVLSGLVILKRSKK